MRPQQSAVFGKRKEPHTIIIARGDKIRHFTVRPWVAAMVGSAVAALAIGYLLATSYLVLRDDLIGATVARQARLQQAYEDRISALRAQLDRVTSRQLLDQQFMQEKVGELLARQDQLTKRQSRLAPVLNRAGAELLPENAPVPAPRPQIKAETDQLLDPTKTGSIAVASFAPSARDTVPWPLRAQTSQQSGQLSAADKADYLFVKLNRALESIETDQIDSVRLLAEDAYQTADAIAGTLEDVGLTIPEDDREQNVGGPLLAATSALVFEDQVRELDEALSHLNEVKTKAKRLPLASPSPGAPITSRFGARKDPFLGRLAHHSGIDFRARRGAPIHATGAGTVVKAGWNGGYGRMVEIDHGNGLTTRYAHMSKILVKTGDKVDVGTKVGKVGSSGRSTGPHLHYEVRRSGAAINPSRFITAGRKIAKYLESDS
ncbi:M23 family metallopeptidase [Nitratireductor rhodophyticola]|uniref:M23 family metallopeptidase n=1 Tax=Nitratireductor rhodophyticola TaxID=2854036 RepID=UPI002AC8F0C0|nr:M23 family metallopeptidase [Nitratireductor rhodophyticola]MEC9243709.1 M23 family metallopeptidase [Pseudomonadota bacterium]WPZ13463.1 M23 family metallopeptidase [Nitratireductor rhodophyticola]